MNRIFRTRFEHLGKSYQLEFSLAPSADRIRYHVKVEDGRFFFLEPLGEWWNAKLIWAEVPDSNGSTCQTADMGQKIGEIIEQCYEQ